MFLCNSCSFKTLKLSKPKYNICKYLKNFLWLYDTVMRYGLKTPELHFNRHEIFKIYHKFICADIKFIPGDFSITIHGQMSLNM